MDVKQNSSSKEELDKLRKKFLKKRTKECEIAYRNKKKSYKKAILTAKNEYYLKRLQAAAKDSKKTWTLINEILQRKSKNEVFSSIFHEGNELTDSKEITEVMAHYYKYAAVKRIDELKSNMNFEQFLNPKEERENKFKLKEISIEDTSRHRRI